jgi:outer membrane receptor protein involved in Fe transport
VNIPPEHRLNVGIGYDTLGFFSNISAAYQGKAFWTDVSDFRMWGPTDAFTMVNAKVGARFPRQGLVVSISALNLFDSKVQQHVWGDFIDRRIIAEVTYRF